MLVKVEQTHMMELVRRVNSTHGEVSRNLKILEKESVLTIRKYGRMKIIRLNRENRGTQALLKALRILEETNFQTSTET